MQILYCSIVQRNGHICSHTACMNPEPSFSYISSSVFFSSSDFVCVTQINPLFPTRNKENCQTRHVQNWKDLKMNAYKSGSNSNSGVSSSMEKLLVRKLCSFWSFDGWVYFRAWPNKNKGGATKVRDMHVARVEFRITARHTWHLWWTHANHLQLYDR